MPLTSCWWLGSARRVVRLADLLGDAPSLTDLVAVVLGPGANLRGVVRGADATGAGGPTAADATCLIGPDSELFAQLLGVVVVEVDLVGDAVETEAHRAGGLRAIDIVDEYCLSLTRHSSSPCIGLT